MIRIQRPKIGPKVVKVGFIRLFPFFHNYNFWPNDLVKLAEGLRSNKLIKVISAPTTLRTRKTGQILLNSLSN